MLQIYPNSIFKQLSKIPFEYQNFNEALPKISQFRKQLLDCHTFILTLIDPQTKNIKKIIGCSEIPQLETEIDFIKKWQLIPALIEQYN